MSSQSSGTGLGFGLVLFTSDRGIAPAAAAKLADEGIQVSVLDLFRLKPVDESRLQEVLRATPAVVSVEEHASIGGLGSLLAEIIAEMGDRPSFRRLSLGDDFFLGTTSRSWAEEHRGLGPEGIGAAIHSLLDRTAAADPRPARRVA